MRLIFCTEARMVQTPDGKVYSMESSFSYSLFKRYLAYFDEVIIFARIKSGLYDEVIESNEVSKERIKIHALPYYVGFNQYILNFFKLRKAIHSGLKRYDVRCCSVICRVPGRVGAEVIRQLRKLDRPYGIEVVGDPHEALSHVAKGHPLFQVIRYFATKSLRSIARNAPIALYVTRRRLQERYPCKQISIGASDVAMREEYYLDEAKRSSDATVLKLICIGSLEQMYKGPDVILKAMSILLRENIQTSLIWIGDGVYKPYVEKMAVKLNVAGQVTFAGKLPAGEAVRKALDCADIFVMPSRTEGLPRAMVEAMARGLPCIGTRVCGIEELLPDSCLVSVNNAQELADKIEMLAGDSRLRNNLGQLNLVKAREYHEKILEPERQKFFDSLKRLSSNGC